MKMTTSGDYNRWVKSPVISYGDALSEQQKEYLEGFRLNNFSGN